LEAFSPSLASLYAVRLDVVMREADEAWLLGRIADCIERRRGTGQIEPAARPAAQ